MQGYGTALPLFDERPEPAAVIPAADPHVREADKPRLSGNNAAVLARLKEGPATTLELMGPNLGGIRPAARVWDLGKRGCIIKSDTVENGMALYTLLKCPEELS